ncbi:EamA family transporter [Curtobacterium sp. MCBD17_013]|uniref:DMT family transporter n=1 Tax=Curtobacterium sp. MCBD17_013 TaxID=2175668 RepID=UPI000DA8203B|nr:DMT family transporter [Curtobacterium sp. MCBD17_013]PZF62963.1 EamA family transporter [Curtobacterium sp. MCBD17_013]
MRDPRDTGRAVPRSARSGSVLVALGAALWGTGGVAGTIVAADSAMSWPAISALRLLGGGIVMLAVTAAMGGLRRVPRSREALGHVLLTAVLTGVYGTAYFESVSLVGVAVSTVISLGVAPVAVAVATALHERRPPRATVVLALATAVVGLLLVSEVSGSEPGAGSASVSGAGVAVGSSNTVGVLLALVAGLAFAGTSIVNRRVIPGLGPSTLIAVSFTLAGVLSAVFALCTGFHLASAGPSAWGGVAFLALVQTVLGYLAFYGGLQRGVAATTAAVLSLVEPLVATVLSVVVLHEPLTVAGVVGIVLLLVAVVLVRPPR